MFNPSPSQGGGSTGPHHHQHHQHHHHHASHGGGPRGPPAPMPSFQPAPAAQLQHTTDMKHLDQIGKQRTKDIRPGTELRIVVPTTEDLYMKAHSKVPDTFATAEVFGEELVLGHEYRLEKGSQLAVFTWHGCTIELRGEVGSEYDASNAVMKDYVNVAGIIEQKRLRAEDLGTAAPRVLVTGSESSGKSTCALFLINYALRKHRKPVFVELDPRCSNPMRQLPGLPGCVCAAVADHSSYELLQEPMPPARLVLSKDPDQPANPFYPLGKTLWGFYGHLNWDADPQLYWKTIGQLGCFVDAREEMLNATAGAPGKGKDVATKSGVIVNGPRNPSVEIIDEIIRIYNIDTVIVIDDSPIYSHLSRKYKSSKSENEVDQNQQGNGGGGGALVFLDSVAEEDEGEKVDIVHLPKAGGVVPITDEVAVRIRINRMQDFFYGPERDLNALTFPIMMRELCVCRIESNPDGRGSPHWSDRFRVVPFNESPTRLRQSLLGVVVAPSIEEIVFSTLAGLVWVRDVTDGEDPMTAVLHILCPGPGPLISNYLIVGDLDNLKYFEV